MKAALLAFSLLLWAPYQCGTEPNETPQEDTAPKALWQLAERFGSEGNADARNTTLNQLVDRYPSSHYAEKARQELGLPSRENNRRSSGSEKSDESEDSDESSSKSSKKKSDEPEDSEDPEAGEQ